MEKAMPTFAATFVAFALAALPWMGATLPRKAPEFVIQSPDGTQTLLTSYKGKTVVMAFMFTTCPHCQNTAKVLSTVQNEYAKRNVQVLGVTFDREAAKQVDAFNKMLGLNFPCGFSTPHNVLQFLGLAENDPYFVPGLVFIDKGGMIRSQYIGDEKFLSSQEVNIRAEIDKLLKGGAAPAAGTKSAPKQAAPKQ